MKTAILFLIFNRPDTEQQVFDAIKKNKPTELYVAADGPRKNKEGEDEKCLQSRKIIDDGVDWKCNVHKLYRNENLGCKVAVSSAIDWFFDNVDEGIILEDDCLPDKSFFIFCSKLLKKYRKNPKVMHIGGNNFQDGIIRGGGSYYFSKYSHIWGWATWRRAWKKYNLKIPASDKCKKVIAKHHSNFLEKLYWDSQLWCVNHNLLNTWDIQWLISIWCNNGICVTPNSNLVVNIGFGKNSTHTKRSSDTIDRAKLNRIEKIKYVDKMTINTGADMYTLENIFGVSLRKLWKILSIVPYSIYKNL